MTAIVLAIMGGFDQRGFRCVREDANLRRWWRPIPSILMPRYRRGVAAVRHSGKLDTCGVRVESRARLKAVSPKGAIGLMQIMPDTWADCACATGSGADPPVIRTTTFARVRLTCERCMIASAWPGFSPPTTPARPLYGVVATGRPLPAELSLCRSACGIDWWRSDRRGVAIAAVPTHGYVRRLFAAVADSTSPHIGRNPPVDCAHVRLPISPGSNRHMIGIRATCPRGASAVRRADSSGHPH